MNPEDTLPPAPDRRRDDKLRAEVASLSTQVVEIRAEQRSVLKELAVEQAKVLGEVRAEQAVVHSKLDANTAMTQEVRDILTTFKTLGAFAKWFSAIAAAVVGMWAAIKGLKP